MYANVCVYVCDKYYIMKESEHMKKKLKKKKVIKKKGYLYL